MYGLLVNIFLDTCVTFLKFLFGKVFFVLYFRFDSIRFICLLLFLIFNFFLFYLWDNLLIVLLEVVVWLVLNVDITQLGVKYNIYVLINSFSMSLSFEILKYN